jgi:cobalt-zinc-cadmium resistance protein CzcA
MVFGVAIITIVYFPILSLTGVEGRTFKPMAQTVIYALMGALALSLTFVPAMCSFLMTRRVREEDNFLVRLAKRSYAPVLTFALKARWLVTGGAVVLFVAAAVLFTRLGAVFVPKLDEGSFAIQMIRTTSIGLDASLEMEKKAQKLLLEKFPEVTHILSRIGTSEVAVDPMGVNVADTYVLLKPPAEWRREDGRPVTKDELADLMNEELTAHLPGQAYLFTQPIELRFNELLSGVRADIAVKIFGEDYAVLERLAGEVREIIERIPGAADVEFDAAGQSPIFEVAMNREAMKRYNVHAGEVNEAVETAFAGK